MNFYEALERIIKNDMIMSRKSWDNDDFIFLASDFEYKTKANLHMLQNKEMGSTDALVLRTTDNFFKVGWTPSQEDLLADDWFSPVYENVE